MIGQEEWEDGRFGGRQQDLGRAAGSVKVGLRREVITPGKQSGPRQAHMSEEEIFVVLIPFRAIDVTMPPPPPPTKGIR